MTTRFTTRKLLSPRDSIIFLLVLAMISQVCAWGRAVRQFNVPDGIYPISGTAGQLPPNDDGFSSDAIPIGFQMTFFSQPVDRVWVNNNGNVTLQAGLSAYTPTQLSGSLGIIAPFWADVDTRAAGTGLTSYGQGTLVNTGQRVFYVNWIDVGYFNSHNSPLNSFQLVLIDESTITGRCGDFAIEFNYDQILWETGDASGGPRGGARYLSPL